MTMLHCSACILKFPGISLMITNLWELKFKIASWEFDQHDLFEFSTSVKLL